MTKVKGVVLLNDKPLPNAHVEFVPEVANFGAELNSTGATDEKGQFTCQTGKSLRFQLLRPRQHRHDAADVFLLAALFLHLQAALFRDLGSRSSVHCSLPFRLAN